MTHVFEIRSVNRWSDFNEYEGELGGVLDGVAVTCHVLAGGGDADWRELVPGRRLEPEVWLERSKEVSVVPPESAIELSGQNR